MYITSFKNRIGFFLAKVPLSLISINLCHFENITAGGKLEGRMALCPRTPRPRLCVTKPGSLLRRKNLFTNTI